MSRTKSWMSLAALCLATACSQEVTGPGIRGSYSGAEIGYFAEIALGAEWGQREGTVRKWHEPIRLRVVGAPTQEDLATLQQVVLELCDLIGPDRVKIVRHGGNVTMTFAPYARFAALEPNYAPGNLGYVWMEWNRARQISRARILIASDHLTQRQRAHLIREELTQALGLLRDSGHYPESIFFQGWSETTEYAPIDRALVEMLYRPEVATGMSRGAVLTVLNRLARAQ